MAVNVPFLDKTKPIVYVGSPLININEAETSSNDYFVQLLTLIVQKIQEVLKTDVVLKLSKSTISDSDNQISLIKEVYSMKDRYSGVIISPVNVSHVWLELREQIKTLNDYKELPIITIDKKINKIVNEISIPSITSDWEDGGACAANTILRYLTIKDDPNPKNILYMPGLEGSEERIIGFTNILKTDSRFILTRLPQADFTREGAKDRMFDFFKKNQNIIDFIFACNDEMALGIRDALQEIQSSNFSNTKVIGFDGTKEFIAAMESETNNILLSTVDVNLSTQVTKLVENIHRLFAENKDYMNLEEFSYEEKYNPRDCEHLFR